MRARDASACKSPNEINIFFIRIKKQLSGK